MKIKILHDSNYQYSLNENPNNFNQDIVNQVYNLKMTIKEFHLIEQHKIDELRTIDLITDTPETDEPETDESETDESETI